MSSDRRPDGCASRLTWVGRGRAQYLPEPVYFDETSGFPGMRAARVTAECSARFASDYEAWPVGYPAMARRGVLPRRRSVRAGVIDGLFDWVERWLEETGQPIPLVGLRLRRSNQVVLDQHDGVPATLFLTPHEFARLQDCLRQAGLPRDLYYPASEQRTVIEPTEYRGGVVLWEKRLSPLQFAHREAAGATPPKLPSEEERLAQLFRACQEFLRPLLLRRAELEEPGRPRDEEQLAEVDALRAHVDEVLNSVGQRILREARREPSGK